MWGIKLRILILKPFVWLQDKWEKYNDWRLKMAVNNEILTSYDYDINVFKKLYNIK